MKDYVANWEWLAPWVFAGFVLALVAVYVYMQVTGEGYSRTVHGVVVWGRRKVDRHGVPIPDPVTPPNSGNLMGVDVFSGGVDREKIERVVRGFCHSVPGMLVLKGELRDRFEYCKIEAARQGSAQPLMEYFEVLRVIAEVLRSHGVDLGPEYQGILKDISESAKSLSVPERSSKGKKQPPTQWDRLLDNDL